MIFYKSKTDTYLPTVCSGHSNTAVLPNYKINVPRTETSINLINPLTPRSDEHVTSPLVIISIHYPADGRVDENRQIYQPEGVILI